MDTRPDIVSETLRDLEMRAETRRGLVQMISDVSAQELLGEQIGSVRPRLWTPPLITGPPGPCPCECALTPDTSYGFDVVTFARDVLAKPLDPWQELAAIHVGELLPDGRPRFRIIIIIVARQNGKTELVSVLTTFWLFIEKQPLILGTSASLEYAKEAWEKAVTYATTNESLLDKLPATDNQGVRRTNGQIEIMLRVPTAPGSTYPHPRYKIAAANRRGGRGLTINRLLHDESREQTNWDAWNASQPATNAVLDSQTLVISNQGDDTAVVLDSLRQSALDGVDERLGILEWSAPEGSLPDDVAALAAANPNAGRRIPVAELLADGRRAMSKGGKELADFQTEIMCMKVRQLNPAVNPVAWGECYSEGDLADVRHRVAMCLDVAIDQQHASVVVAAVIDREDMDERLVRVEAVDSWDGPGCVNAMVMALPGLVALVKPKVVGWFPGGPAVAAASRLAERRPGKRTPRWPPRGVRLEEITKDACAVCMEFADLVNSRLILQAGAEGDDLIGEHVLGAEKLWHGDVWRFGRRDVGYVDAAYAAAGAVSLAVQLPQARPAAGAR
jgi:hypothetical protein